MKRILNVAKFGLIVSVLVLLIGCGSGLFTFSNPSEPVVLFVGDKFQIELMGGGFERITWSNTYPGDGIVTTYLSQNSHETCSRCPDPSLQMNWVFEANNPGITTLIFVASNAQTETFYVTVY